MPRSCLTVPLLLRALVFIAIFAGELCARTASGSVAELNEVGDILAIDGRDADAKPRGVKLTGVVLGVNVPQNEFTLHDGTKSVGVLLEKPEPDLKQGDKVEITGRTTKTNIGSVPVPRVLATSLKVTGTAPLPKALPVDVGTLISFKHFDQWVSLDCFVMEWSHAKGQMTLRVIAAGGYAAAFVRMPDASATPAKFHGARVRLTGVCGGDRTPENALFVPSAAQIEMLEHGTADVFDAPLASASDLLARKLELGRRWRAKGVVAATTQQRKLMLVCPDAAMTVYLLQPRATDEPGTVYGDAGRWPPPQPGDVVEVVGSTFETTNSEGYSQGLSWCHLRILGHEEAPKPRMVDLETLLGWRNHDEWCSVEAIVTGWTQRGAFRSYSVVDPHGWAIFHVRDVPAETFPTGLHGARMRFTGISRSRLRNSSDALLVPNPSFVEIVKPGSADPFAVQEVAMKDILKKRKPSAEHVRTRGVVIGRIGALSLYVRGEDDSAMCVSLQGPWQKPAFFNGEFYADAGPIPQLNIGDEVEVVGCPIQPHVGVEVPGFDLYQTHARVIGKAAAPQPVAAKIRAVAEGAHTNDLVEVRGRVVAKRQLAVGSEWRTTLVMESGGAQLPASFQGRTFGALSTLRVDDDVLVRGLVDRETPAEPRQLRIASTEDVKTFGLSPVVARRRFWLWGGSSLGLVLLLGGWVFVLMRANRMQSKSAAELQVARDAALESENRWKLLFEQSPLSVQIFAPDGSTMRFNQAWKNLFRLSDEQGRAFNVLKDPDLNASGAVNLIRKAFEGEVVHVPPVPFPVNTDPPEHRWIGGVLYPVKNGAGQIMEVVTIHNDITEMKRAEEAMREINQTLERRVQERTSELEKTQADLQRALEQERELNELKTRFVSMVSHEFRTPLGIIMSAVELLQHYSDRLPEDEKQRQLHEIQSGTKHMGDLMEQVLLLGRAEAGKLSCRPRPLDLVCFAERIIDETQSISDRKCAIKLETEGDLSDANADEALLRHIFGNLIGNAVKYSPVGSDVSVRIRRAGGDVVWEIIDRGIGIPEKDRARLFEAFYRCSNVGETQGTGLGLVIVKRCVDLHSGRIDLQSEPGSGTTFIVTIPVYS